MDGLLDGRTLPPLSSDAGLTALQDLSLAGCEQLTPLGLRWVAGLTRLRRLSLQTCHRIR